MLLDPPMIELRQQGNRAIMLEQYSYAELGTRLNQDATLAA